MNNAKNTIKETRQICNVKLGNGKVSFNEIQVINALLKEGQKKIEFTELNEYCCLKKNIKFLIKRFKNIGFVPNFFVKDDMFYCIKVIRYSFRGRRYESLSYLPLCRAFGRFKRYELN